MPTEAESLSNVVAAVPEWVSKMQQHFREHGFYRPEDLDRVLGSPQTHVEVQVSNTNGANILITK